MARTDEELLEAWRAGDRRAGNDLFQRHFEPIRRFFVNKTDGEAAELVQTTFERCLGAQARFEGRSSFRTFLFGIAAHVLQEHYRARQRAKNNPDDVDQLSLVDLGVGPSTGLRGRQEQQILLTALRSIPLRFQIVLELYFWEQLTGAQIGEILSIPENTARSRIRRGKALLEQVLPEVAQSPALAETVSQDLDAWAAGIRKELG